MDDEVTHSITADRGSNLTTSKRQTIREPQHLWRSMDQRMNPSSQNQNHDISAKGRTSIIACAVDGTVYTIDADTGTVRGFFTSGDGLVGRGSSTDTESSSFLTEKIVPGLDGYLYKLSSEANSITPFINVTDVINNPVKTCHPTSTQWHHNSLTPLDEDDGDIESEEGVGELCGIVTGEKKSKIFAFNVQTGSISWIHSDGVKYGGPRSSSFGEAQHHSFATPPTSAAEEAVAYVLLQREDYLVRHVDQWTGETNWDVRVAYFKAWEFPSFEDTTTTATSNTMTTMVAPRRHTQLTQQQKATPVEGSIYSSIIQPRKTTIPELRAMPHLSPILPSIAFSEDGKHLTAIDTYSRSILWRRQMPFMIINAYGVTNENSWIKLNVVDEGDYIEKHHQNEGSSSLTNKNEVCQSERTLVPSSPSSVSLLSYNYTAAMDDPQKHHFRLENFSSTLFVSPRRASSLSSINHVDCHRHSSFLPEITSTAVISTSFNGIGYSLKEQQQLTVWNNSSFADSPWTTPSFGKFHKLEHGLFLTWQGVTIVAALLITGIAFVRFSYLRQKQKWMLASASSAKIYSSTLDSPIGDRSIVDVLPRRSTLDATIGAVSQGKTLKKRTSSLPIIRSGSSNGDDIDPVSFSSSTFRDSTYPINSSSRSTSHSIMDSKVAPHSDSKSNAPRSSLSVTATKGDSISMKIPIATTPSSDASGAVNFLRSIPSSVDGIPLVRYSRYKSEFNDLSSLGKGGFGTVFRCQNVLDGREYAVKKIRIKSFVDELGVSTNHLSLALRRVLREVKILALLDHPNIVRYYTAWLEIDDELTLADEDFHGETRDNSYLDCKKSSITQFSDPSRENTRSNLLQLPSLNFQKSKSQLDFLSELQHANNTTPAAATEDLGFSWDIGEETNGVYYFNEQSEATESHDNSSHEEKSSSCDKKNPTVPSALMTQRYILYIQMQLCSQSTLSDFLASPDKRKRSPLTLTGDKSGSHQSNAAINIPHALRVFSQIARGVKHVHSQGLIHRDLKPSNCFIDETGTVKIGDFGLSRETVKSGIEEIDDDCENIQHKGGFEQAEGITAGVGTRSYASPEQINGSDYDASTDVYSLGIILFELCYPMNTSMERYLVFSGLRQRIFPTEWVSTVASLFPTLHDLVYAMLSPTPSERPTSAVVASHIDKLLGEFVFSLGRGWERKGERPLLLRVEAVDVEGILPRTVNLIKLAAPDADIVQYGLKGQGSIAVMEFAIVFSEAKDEPSCTDCASIAQLEIFRTLSASDEIKLIREVTTDLCPNLESMDNGRKIIRRRSSSLVL